MVVEQISLETILNTILDIEVHMIFILYNLKGGKMLPPFELNCSPMQPHFH